MKVILRKDVKGKGNTGNIIDVKLGFARNYLIPRGLAYPATDAKIKVYEQEKYLKAKKQVQLSNKAEVMKVEMEKISLTTAVKVGEDDRLADKNLQFHQLLQQLQIPHTMTTIKGAGHNYQQVYQNWPGNPFNFYSQAFSR